MIDKRIFYCWFGGGEMSDLNKRCIASQKKYCPDYELVEINEHNFDYTISDYAIEGYEKGNWSAVSNTARLYFLREGNGFYLDTDVELIKSLDELRDLDRGFITEFDIGQPDSGVLGCGIGFPHLYDIADKELVKGSVLHKNFIRNMYKDYDYYGQSKITYDDGFTILGEEWFPTVRSGFITDKTIGVHYFENTWMKNMINITDPFYPFVRVLAYKGNNLVHEDREPKARIFLTNHEREWNSPQTLGRANYLFNPRVMKVQTRDFVAERINWDKNIPTDIFITAGNAVVTYII